MDDNYFETQRCAILGHFSMCCDTLCASVHDVRVGVLFTHPVGCLDFFFSQPKLVLTLRINFMNRQTMKNA